MSHVTQMELVVTDLDILRSNAEECGMEMIETGTYKWYGRHVGDYPIPEGFTQEDLGKCSYALRVKGNPNAYEVGVIKNPNGDGYVLLWDFWQDGFGLKDAIGSDGHRLTQGYQADVVVKQARREGFRVKRWRDAKTGNVMIKLKQ